MIVSLLPVIAIEQSETEITNNTSLTDNSFQIKGYYKGELATSLTFEIKDLSENVLYQSYAEATDDDHVDSTKNIFTWKMTGRTQNKTPVTVRFTFDTLQAELEGKFYRPQYTMKMTLNPSKDSSGNNLTDLFYSSNTGAKLVKLTSSDTYTATKPNTPANSRYTETGFIEYSSKISNSNGNTYVRWVRSGYCTLNISDYEDSIPGSYDYTCTVRVEITL